MAQPQRSSTRMAPYPWTWMATVPSLGSLWKNCTEIPASAESSPSRRARLRSDHQLSFHRVFRPSSPRVGGILSISNTGHFAFSVFLACLKAGQASLLPCASSLFPPIDGTLPRGASFLTPPCTCQRASMQGLVSLTLHAKRCRKCNSKKRGYDRVCQFFFGAEKTC